MGLFDKFKKPKKSFEEELLDNKVALKSLEKRYNNMINMLTIEIREGGNSMRENAEATTRLKTAYYSLQLVKTAERRMNSVQSSFELSKCLKDTASALKGASKLDDKANPTNTKLLQRWTKKLLERDAAAATGGMKQVYDQPIDVLVEDEIVDRLIKGESLKKVMDGDKYTKASSADMFDFLDIDGDGNVSAASLDADVTDFDDLFKDL